MFQEEGARGLVGWLDENLCTKHAPKESISNTI